MTKEFAYVASRDVADSLRMDASEVGPKFEGEIKVYVRVANEKLLDIWGKFIPKETKRKAKGVEDRAEVPGLGEFYEKRGFKKLGEEPVDEGEDGKYWLMEKKLA